MLLVRLLALVAHLTSTSRVVRCALPDGGDVTDQRQGGCGRTVARIVGLRYGQPLRSPLCCPLRGRRRSFSRHTSASSASRISSRCVTLTRPSAYRGDACSSRISSSMRSSSCWLTRMVRRWSRLPLAVSSCMLYTTPTMFTHCHALRCLPHDVVRLGVV